jgi:hypothetical protein
VFLRANLFVQTITVNIVCCMTMILITVCVLHLCTAVYVALMPVPSDRTANAYEVMIGGYGNTRSTIRIGCQGTVAAVDYQVNLVSPALVRC